MHVTKTFYINSIPYVVEYVGELSSLPLDITITPTPLHGGYVIVVPYIGIVPCGETDRAYIRFTEEA